MKWRDVFYNLVLPGIVLVMVVALLLACGEFKEPYLR